jgi:hypothetical protein
MISSCLQSYIPFDRPASRGSKTTATRVETERREYRDWRSRIERVEWRSITYSLHPTKGWRVVAKGPWKVETRRVRW